jgi:hypothetical protein
LDQIFDVDFSENNLVNLFGFFRLLDIDDGHENIGASKQNFELRLCLLVNSRVIAHLFKLHQKVNFLDKLFPSAQKHLVFNIGAIDELYYCVEQEGDEFVGPKV